MQRFSGTHLAVVMNEIGEYLCQCEEKRSRGESDAGSALIAFANHALLEAESLCKNNLAFDAARSKVSLVQIHYKHNTPDVSTIAADLRNVRDMIMHDVWNLRFLQIDSRHKNDLDNVNLLGEHVANSFQSAHQDIKDAGNALSVGFPNSAVFHLMRVVELGLRALAVHLGFRKVKSKRKGGSTKLTPVAYAEWETLLNQIQGRVDAKVAKLRPGKVKQRTQEFYYPVLQDIRAIRDAWRVHVMHSRADYTDADAEAIFSHVKRLMAALATRVSEV